MAVEAYAQRLVARDAEALLLKRPPDSAVVTEVLGLEPHVLLGVLGGDAERDYGGQEFCLGANAPASLSLA